MPLKETANLGLVDERSRLIENNQGIWNRSYEYPLDTHSERVHRKQTAQWALFIGITIVSVFLILGLLGASRFEKETIRNGTTLGTTTLGTTTTTSTTTILPDVTQIIANQTL